MRNRWRLFDLAMVEGRQAAHLWFARFSSYYPIWCNCYISTCQFWKGICYLWFLLYYPLSGLELENRQCNPRQVRHHRGNYSSYWFTYHYVCPAHNCTIKFYGHWNLLSTHTGRNQFIKLTTTSFTFNNR